eukprot:12937203-Alexandrium_andersonii.AAC.1
MPKACLSGWTPHWYERRNKSAPLTETERSRAHSRKECADGGVSERECVSAHSTLHVGTQGW